MTAETTPLDIVVAELFEDMGISGQTARESIAFLCEEVGELAKATRTGDRKNLREEIGDVGILLVRIAHLSGIDLDQAIRAKVSERLARHRAEQVKKSMTPHPDEDVCFWCATDDQYADS
jgi:NTP pyrophosphatase (non-canonical NTP hydrolase)